MPAPAPAAREIAHVRLAFLGGAALAAALLACSSAHVPVTIAPADGGASDAGGSDQPLALPLADGGVVEWDGWAGEFVAGYCVAVPQPLRILRGQRVPSVERSGPRLPNPLQRSGLRAHDSMRRERATGPGVGLQRRDPAREVPGRLRNQPAAHRRAAHDLRRMARRGVSVEHLAKPRVTAPARASTPGASKRASRRSRPLPPPRCARRGDRRSA